MDRILQELGQDQLHNNRNLNKCLDSLDSVPADPRAYTERQNENHNTIALWSDYCKQTIDWKHLYEIKTKDK